MKHSKLILIALATVALLAACAKQETSAATPATESKVASAPAESTPPPAAEPAASEAPAASTAVEPAVEPAAQPAAVATSTPAPMLPRRGEAVTPVETHSEHPEDPAQQSQRVTVADAYEILKANNGVLVDVRSADAYKFQHIPGALSIPLQEIANRARELPQDKWIITYCTCPAEESSGAAASTLANMGFERVAALLGGMQTWRSQGLPMEYGGQ